MQAIRVVFLGAVDEGKSSLLGRLLVEAKVLKQDELESVRVDSDQLDLSLFTDGLSIERSERKTVDASYRYLRLNETPHIWIDAPGHLEYLPNAIGAATQAQVAVVVISAARAKETTLPTMTCHHLNVIKTLGIEEVLFVVNKMDLVKDDPLPAIQALVTKAIDLSDIRYRYFTVSATDTTKSITPLLEYLRLLSPNKKPFTEVTNQVTVRVMSLVDDLDLNSPNLQFIQVGALGAQGTAFNVKENGILKRYQSAVETLVLSTPLYTTSYKKDTGLGGVLIINENQEIQAIGTVI